MKPSLHTQMLLFLALCAFTAINLTPIFWAFMVSIKQPVDAFAAPPMLIFTPTFEFHYSVWVERGFWRFLLNSVIIAVAVVCISVPIGTMAAARRAGRPRVRRPGR